MSGGVVVENDVGIIELDPGEFGYIETISSDPMYIDDSYGTVLFAKADDKKSEPKSELVAQSESEQDGLVQEVVIETVDDADNILATADIVAPTETITNAIAAPRVGSSSAIADMIGDKMTFDPNKSTLLGEQTVGTNSDINVSWGRWDVGTEVTVTDSNGISTVHTVDGAPAYWMSASDFDPTAYSAKTGLVTMYAVGGTLSDGSNVGADAGVSMLDVNFSSDTIDYVSIDVKDGASTYMSAYSTTSTYTIDTQTGNFSGNFDAVDYFPGPTNSTSGSFSGSLVGDSTAATVGYQLYADDVTQGDKFTEGVVIFE
jgi:hypothetical protein